MCRRLASYAVVVLVLLIPSRVLAGGPPWLCLPIDGTADENLKATNDLLTAKLQSKLFPPDVFRGLAILQQGVQSYATLFIKEDVSLGEVESALKGSGISVPRDRLQLFGYVTLEIDPRAANTKELLADLDALDHVSIATSENKDGLLLVTIDMPYPDD